ncbi:unnamed protein product, partial [Bubo scandiacus]
FSATTYYSNYAIRYGSSAESDTRKRDASTASFLKAWQLRERNGTPRLSPSHKPEPRAAPGAHPAPSARPKLPPTPRRRCCQTRAA